MDRDHEIFVKYKNAALRSGKDVKSHVQSKMVSTHDKMLEKDLIKNTKVYGQALTSKSFQTNKSDQVKPKKYRFVHSDGTVEMFTDTTVVPNRNKSQIESSRHGPS